MRGSGKVFMAGLVLCRCLAAGSPAVAVEKEPVTGGLLVLPGAAAPAPMPQDNASWGLLVRGGYFGLPNLIADELFFQHPDIGGTSFGGEIRYNGKDGRRAGTSIGLAVDTTMAQTDGDWRRAESDSVVTASGDISMLAITLTYYWILFPSWYVHPSIGLGLGAAHLVGHYQSDVERVDADIWIPVLHIPVGLAVELGERLQLAIEGRFVDGIAVGAALQVRF